MIKNITIDCNDIAGNKATMKDLESKIKECKEHLKLGYDAIKQLNEEILNFERLMKAIDMGKKNAIIMFACPTDEGIQYLKSKQDIQDVIDEKKGQINTTNMLLQGVMNVLKNHTKYYNALDVAVQFKMKN